MLTGWKEIAQYMGRGVRTVQRWERDFHLPIHRPKGTNRSSVFALRDELDHWAATRPSGIAGTSGINSLAETQRTRQLIAETQELTKRLLLRRTEFQDIRRKLLLTAEKLRERRTAAKAADD
jgi:phage terminase Nu1 subunit (DNA packaging protein)